MGSFEHNQNSSSETDHHSTEADFWADAYRNVTSAIGTNLSKGIANVVDCIEHHPVETIGGGLLAATAIYMTRGKILGEKVECAASELSLPNVLENAASKYGPMSTEALKMRDMHICEVAKNAVEKYCPSVSPEINTPGLNRPVTVESADPMANSSLGGRPQIDELWKSFLSDYKKEESLLPHKTGSVNLGGMHSFADSMANFSPFGRSLVHARWRIGMTDVDKAGFLLPSKSEINEKILRITQ